MRVVICDDGPLNLKVWGAFLRKLGHEVVGEGKDGRDAVRLCEHLRPDLAMLDMSMGDYGGDRAAREIIRDGTAGKVLVASSLASAKAHVEADGAAFIVKPICDYQQLGLKLKSVFGE